MANTSALPAKRSRPIISTSLNPLSPFDLAAAVGTLPSRIECARYSKYVVEAAQANVERRKVALERQKQYAAARVEEADLIAKSKLVKAKMKDTISGRFALMREELAGL